MASDSTRIEQSRKAHAALRALRMSFRIVEVLGTAEQETARGTIWLSRPGRACLEFDPPQARQLPPGAAPGLPQQAPELAPPGRPINPGSPPMPNQAARPGKPALVSDGKRFVFTSPPAGWAATMVSQPNEAGIRAVLDTARVFDIGLVDLLCGVAPWGGDFTVVQDTASSTVEGVECREVVLTCGRKAGVPAEIRLSIGTRDGLARRIRSERTDGSGGVSEVTFSGVVVNDPPPPGRFRVETKGLRPAESATAWNRNLDPGVPAPLLIGDDLNGREVDIANWSGSVVLIHFWATFEPRSLWRIPEIVAVRNRFRSAKDFRVVGVCLDSKDNSRAVRRAIADWKIDWPQIHDGLGWDSGPVKVWKIEGLPVTALVGRDGAIVEMDPVVSLGQSVAAALAKRPLKSR